MNANAEADRFVVVTGGPGAGKTTLIDALQAAGYARTVEAGRAIIQDQVVIGGRAVPWDDRLAFAEAMLCWEIRSYRMAQAEQKLVFFDRGIPDVLGYLRLIGSAAPPHMEKAASIFRYRPQVFIAPPWPEIFRQDHERKQDFAEAIRTYDAMVAAYSSSGYVLIELPRAPIDERVRFILDAIGSDRA